MDIVYATCCVNPSRPPPEMFHVKHRGTSTAWPSTDIADDPCAVWAFLADRIGEGWVAVRLADTIVLHPHKAAMKHLGREA